MFFTIPTILTWTRIVAIPLLVGVFYLPITPPMQNLVATVMFIVFALTDWLDGYLARRLNQTSSFGAFLDPVADKFLVCASLLVLVHLKRPAVFVAIWSTGFIVARYGMPHSPPFKFLAFRYLFSVICFAAWALAARAAWPRDRSQVLHLGVTGVLMHAGYLGGVWAAVKDGM